MFRSIRVLLIAGKMLQDAASDTGNNVRRECPGCRLPWRRLLRSCPPRRQRVSSS